MGCFCCCFHDKDLEENTNTDTNNAANDNSGCSCPNCLLLSLLDKCAKIFRYNVRPSAASPAVNNGAPSSLNSNAASNNAQQPHTTITTLPETLSIDSNPRCPNLQQDGRTADDAAAAGQLQKDIARVYYIYASLDEYDICPTCLEEFTFENPRIVTKCKHHYHLGCIYEWMERSETCPVCGKVMLFDEAS